MWLASLPSSRGTIRSAPSKIRLSWVTSKIEHLTQYLESCPDLRVGDPEVAARAFIGTLIHYVLIEEVLHGRDLLPMDRDRLINNLVDLIVVPSS